jgi:hypothetical protein
MTITPIIDKIEAMTIADTIQDYGRAKEYTESLEDLRLRVTRLQQINALYYGTLYAISDFMQLDTAVRNLIKDTLNKTDQMEEGFDA